MTPRLYSSEDIALGIVFALAAISAPLGLAWREPMLPGGMFCVLLVVALTWPLTERR